MRDLTRTAEVGWARESQERRAKNRQGSADILTALGIPFESKNDGSHLVLTLPDRVIDFWPGTGLFTDRKTRKNGRGVHALAKRVTQLAANTPKAN